MIQPNSENTTQTSTTIYPLPTGKAILETDTSSPSPHLTSNDSYFDSSDTPNHPDYLRLILTSRVYEIVKETPLVHAINLSLKLNNKILLKREDLQDVFSFKIRGAYNKMAHLTEEERKRGVIACSAGNHAQGVAMSAKKLGLPATIVMPLTTPSIKYKNVERLGSNVVLHGSDFDEAKQECLRLQNLHKYTNIPPYDDPYVIAGQGTIGMEILRQYSFNEIDAIFACVGGGGLIAGIGSYIKRICPSIKIFGVEAVDANAMTLSLKENKRVVLKEVGLFADGAAVKVVGEETFRVCTEVVDGMITVTNDEISGALGLAGVKKYIAENNVVGGCLVAITSGANMNFERLRFVAERAGFGEQHEALISVIIPERPGSFIALYNHIDPRPITEFSYRYSDSEKAWIYMSFRVNNRGTELQTILENLKKDGMHGLDISDNEIAKSHARYLVGGRSIVENERLFRFEFPERPGALKKFLTGLKSSWNISLFHYRNHDIGKVLVGIQVPLQDYEAFEKFKNKLGYHCVEETDNLVYKQFLK
ncbi:1808_t:CDS:2 [Entrophospora sp. SA101]|nr:1808_t:CDS:2 [Entrophospora sp. SA101]